MSRVASATPLGSHLGKNQWAYRCNCLTGCLCTRNGHCHGGFQVAIQARHVQYCEAFSVKNIRCLHLFSCVSIVCAHCKLLPPCKPQMQSLAFHLTVALREAQITVGPDLLRKCGALFFMIFLKSPGARTVSTKEMLTENIIATTSGNPFL